MWVSFRPVKDRKMLVDIAGKLMKVKPIRIEKVKEGWRLSLKLNNRAA